MQAPQQFAPSSFKLTPVLAFCFQTSEIEFRHGGRSKREAAAQRSRQRLGMPSKHGSQHLEKTHITMGPSGS